MLGELFITIGALWLAKVLFFWALRPRDNLTMGGPPPLPLVGNVLEMMADPLVKFQEYRKKYGGVFKYYYFTDPVVVISDPASVQCILHTHSQKYHKEQDPVIMDVIGKGLLLANGEFWKKHRKIMNPSFGSLFLKRTMSCFTDVAQVLVNNFDEYLAKQTEFNLHLEMTKVTLDVIGLAGFGYEFHALSDSNGVVPSAVTTILHETEERIFSGFGLWRLPFMPATVRFENAKKILIREISSMIDKRRSGGEDLQNAKDLLGRLMAATDPDTGEELGDKQLMDELITFLIAGHETTAASLAFTFYLLSQHRDVERKVLEEIDEVVGDGPITYEAIQQLKYLPLVMKESMRLYPSVAMQTTRISQEDDQIGPYFIPKGTFVELWPWLLHRSEEVWGKDVLEFKPERFRNVTESWKYTPFGGGPRNCIGQNLALLESKVILVSVLQKYKTRMAEGHQMTPIISITLRPKDLIMVLKRRKRNLASKEEEN